MLGPPGTRTEPEQPITSANHNENIMAIKAPVTGQTDFSPIPAGTHHAVCYGVVDLGTQPSTMFEPSRKILIQWELPEERADFEREGKRVNLPRATSRQFTLSMHPKSNLRAFLAAWRGKPFTDEEAGDFDITKLVGANCLLNIVHAEGKGQNAGKTYANVSGASPLMKGMVRKNQENPPLILALDDFAGKTITFPQNMPEWIQKLISGSEEFLARVHGSARSAESSHEDSFENALPREPAAASRPKGGDDGQAFPTGQGIPDEDVPF